MVDVSLNQGYMKVIYESERVRQKKDSLRDQKCKILSMDPQNHKSKDSKQINDFITGRLEKSSEFWEKYRKN